MLIGKGKRPGDLWKEGEAMTCTLVSVLCVMTLSVRLTSSLMESKSLHGMSSYNSEYTKALAGDTCNSQMPYETSLIKHLFTKLGQG